MNNGILLVDKCRGVTSFRLVSILRRITKIDCIGHAGTLDPFATGLMVMLIGRPFTKRSNEFLMNDKAYKATVHLGISTDTYDLDGQITARSDKIPSLAEIERAIETFQGEILQPPPMFSAKKIEGKKLYELARKGISIDRPPVKVRLQIELLEYAYPNLKIQVLCSKGTYIRTLAHDLGTLLGTGAHLIDLTRTASGTYSLIDAVSQQVLEEPGFNLAPHLRH